MAPLERFYSARSTYEEIFEHSDRWEEEPSSSSQPLPSRRVRFSNTVSIVRVASKKTLPAKIKATIWYRKKDFVMFRESCRRILEATSTTPRTSKTSFLSACANDEENCTRGLEKYCRDGTLLYMQRSTSMMNDFFLFQNSGASPEQIARIVSEHTAVSKLEALERARTDEREAIYYQMKTVDLTTDAAVLSSLLPKVRNLLKQEQNSATEQTRRRNSLNERVKYTQRRGLNKTPTDKISSTMSSTSERARRMRQHRLRTVPIPVAM